MTFESAAKKGSRVTQILPMEPAAISTGVSANVEASGPQEHRTDEAAIVQNLARQHAGIL